MALKDFRFNSLSRTTQALIFLLLSGGLVLLSYNTWLRGPMQEAQALREEVRQLEESVAKGTAVAAQRDKFRSEFERLETRLASLRRILPSGKETPQLLHSVQQMAAASNLGIVKFTPMPIVPHSFYVDWPILMEVQGSYGALGQFFERVGQASRLIYVEEIAIAGIEGSTDPNLTLRATCTAITFVFREDLALSGAQGGSKQ